MNDYLFFSIGTAFALSLILVPFIIEAQAVTTITDFKIKAVVTFDRPGLSETQITNFLTNQVWPDIRDNIIIPKLDNNFITYTMEKKLKVIQLDSDTWQFYPKFIISGETNLSTQQLRNGFDSTIDNIKDAIQVHMDNQGATNVKYHLHKSTGTVEINE